MSARTDMAIAEHMRASRTHLQRSAASTARARSAAGDDQQMLELIAAVEDATERLLTTIGELRRELAQRALMHGYRR